jgi:hypothetical protein
MLASAVFLQLCALLRNVSRNEPTCVVLLSHLLLSPTAVEALVKVDDSPFVVEASVLRESPIALLFPHLGLDGAIAERRRHSRKFEKEPLLALNHMGVTCDSCQNEVL